MRVEIAVLATAPDGRTLLVRQPGTAAQWRMPRGEVHDGVLLGDAAARGLAAETGIRLTVTHCLALDQAHTTDMLTIVCDCGTVTDDIADTATTTPADLRWVPDGFLDDYVHPDEKARIHAATRAREQSNGIRLSLDLGVSS
ncbi:NUDIX domain-containing protein [Streptomyces clavuligerus]|nr:NUDIX hydrolase [Streptomyces clavuligerus]MBY6307761.1 NUDIX hydrolase [Streptomyces clavuligerus]QCS09694.1 NUDIX hydrolase [Streptomyces clavuligerus]QPJ98264.1 NUDIX domain-containing protein [Streptomyces clavuligerus]WDN56399.1 NUDIX hydrolase [Streptomyces clavuligerus]